MPAEITLYHGSIHIFDKIDISYGKPFKDFGIGFYTSQDIEHSKNLALRNRNIEEIKFKRLQDKPKVQAWLYEYKFNLDNLANLKFKQFQNADKEWVEFVVKNRTSEVRQHDYDVVIGPTANDNTRVTIQAFFAGLYGDISTNTAIETFVKMIETDKLPPQIYFGSNTATNLLIFQGRQLVQ